MSQSNDNYDNDGNSEQLRVAMHKRGRLRGNLTRFNSWFIKLKDEPQVTTNHVNQLKMRMDSLHQTFRDFVLIQAGIESMDDSEFHDEYKEEFENVYYESAAEAETFIQKHACSGSTPEAHRAELNNSVSQQSSSAIHVKLPTINLPTFDGSCDQWIKFHDTFQSIINDNETLSSIQKFQYLRSSLIGSASETIKSLPISASNYELAWDRLCKRYHHKKLIVENHLKALFGLQPVQKNSHIALRSHLDKLVNNVQALEVLQHPSVDDMLVYLAVSKLDAITREKWEEATVNIDFPTFSYLTEFLQDRCKIMESRLNKEPEIHSTPTNNQVNGRRGNNQQSSVKAYAAVQANCPMCKRDHALYQCESFINLTIDERYKTARNLGLCTNCLKGNHVARFCRGSKCRKCNGRHNTLLHKGDYGKKADTIQANPNDATSGTSTSTSAPTVIQSNTASIDTIHAAQVYYSNHGQVLLSTAVVNVANNQGKMESCRVLLDSGSQSNFITGSFVRKLGLRVESVQIPIIGIGNCNSEITKRVTTAIKSKTSDFKAKLQFLVLPMITNRLPIADFASDIIPVPANLALADPQFNIAAPVDALLGAEIFWELMCIGQIRLSPHPRLILQKTQLGWIISGQLHSKGPDTSKRQSLVNVCHQGQDLNKTMSKFWEVEELQRAEPMMTPEEMLCEQQFVQSTTRDDNGRFIVKLPFKDPIRELGDSARMAENRFLALERRLDKQPDLKRQYVEFLEEYEQLGHMVEITDTTGKEDGYFLPHHCVLKDSSTTTKLRVVFDGSAKTSNGLSLNDTLLTGATVQSDLFSIVARFRTYALVLSADVEKMYRQVLVEESHVQFQKIFWRCNVNDPLKVYALKTVTYGTTPAPYLATRCLVELANLAKLSYPREAEIIHRDFYVDDLITGSQSREETLLMKNNISTILNQGGFRLRKWRTNDAAINELIHNEEAEEMLSLHQDNTSKTLGLMWNSAEDWLQYEINVDLIGKATKRRILSAISQLFDPLGLVGPIIITAKVIMQKLWQLKLDWDESIPMNLFCEWTDYCVQLTGLMKLRIPRNVITHINWRSIELHGFCDASESAYGCCIYLRSTIDDETYASRLLCSKSRVAPLKSISLPRLELCSAVLLAELVNKLSSILRIPLKNQYLWSDSMIALAWISGTPKTWTTFVANRVSQIQGLTKGCIWRHVGTKQNPADIISRGTTPDELRESSLWWSGPKFLNHHQSKWPTQPTQQHCSLEQKRIPSHTLTAISPLILIDKYSSLVKLKRVTAWCLRFGSNCKRGAERKSGELTCEEIEVATIKLLKICQESEFKEEIATLSKGKQLNKQSKLLTLNPFIHTDGLLRVGGRLSRADLPFSQKHPIILPSNHRMTTMIVDYEHLRHLHGGAQFILANIRIKFWPMGGKNTIKRILRTCVRCCRVKPRLSEHIMGDLPATRVQRTRPFSNCGVDYCGPFKLCQLRRRNAAISKGYIAVFVCFVTKATHLEVVLNLSTEAFINAFKRFVARRGSVSNLYSDNATNFVGAKNEFEHISALLRSPEFNDNFQRALVEIGTTWRFIPPRSPHFGGLWEAAVKSAKHHLKRVVGENVLTYEELNTLIIQIEACLNSRPLTPISTDPNDYTALTPSHFLIGESLTASPQLNVTLENVNLLSYWKRIQHMFQGFWRRWSKEYLSQLQQRSKWLQHLQQDGLQPGALVTIKDDNLAPLHWKLGRILELSVGDDNVARVATVQTSRGVQKITVRKLCVLPIPIDNGAVVGEL